MDGQETNLSQSEQALYKGASVEKMVDRALAAQSGTVLDVKDSVKEQYPGSDFRWLRKDQGMGGRQDRGQWAEVPASPDVQTFNDLKLHARPKEVSDALRQKASRDRERMTQGFEDKFDSDVLETSGGRALPTGRIQGPGFKPDDGRPVNEAQDRAEHARARMKGNRSFAMSKNPLPRG